jgi:hypothetical protein
VAPVAFALAEADCSAWIVIAPVVASGASAVPMLAEVSTIEIATAMTGVTASPVAVVALAPFFASTTEVCPPVAASVSVRAPTRTAPLSMDALVASSTTETAIERPRPKAVPLASAASAFVVDPESGSAVSETSPVPPASVTTAALPMAAVEDARTRLTAREPATLFLPPPAPLVASAPYVLVVSDPTVRVFASAVRLATLARPSNFASVALKARLIATAAPTVVPVAEPVVVAEPSAFAVESVLPFALSVSAPAGASGVPMLMPAGTVAFWWTSLIVSAIAAATWSGLLSVPLFSDDSAFGVVLLPVPLPPFAAATVSACVRSPASLESTVSPAGWSAESSPGAPFADAVAFELALDAFSAVNVTAPVAAMSRSVVAIASRFANVRAIAAPTAALPVEDVSPDAAVVADAVVFAMKLAAPVGLCCGPGWACELLPTLLIASASAPATVTPPPVTPVFASVIISSAAVALNERSWLVVVANVPSSAATLLVTMFNAIEAPTPALVPET